MFHLSQKLFVPSVGVVDADRKIILVADHQPEMSKIYANLFENLECLAHTCHEIHKLESELANLEPHVLILNITTFADQAIKRVKSMRSSYPEMVMVTLSDSGNDVELHRLMELGVVGHLNKQLTRPRDVLLLVKHVLSLN